MAEKKEKIKETEVAVATRENIQGAAFGLNMEEMAQAGLHFGHRTSRINPKMKPYIYGTRNSVHIIDLEKTVDKFSEALQFIKELISANKNILFVGTKIQVKNLLKEVAEECDLPYVSERWLGGTFTNFEVLKKRIDYFKDLERKKKEGELEKYTKKERVDMDKEIMGLEIKFKGIKNMVELPEAIFVLDIKKDDLAVKEAILKKIKVIGIVDTNTDPTIIDFPIPANDDAINSVRYILNKVKEVILAAKPKAQKPSEK